MDKKSFQWFSFFIAMVIYGNIMQIINPKTDEGNIIGLIIMIPCLLFAYWKAGKIHNNM